MEPLVSILIPAYNAQQWVAESIQSVLAQSWPNKELVLVDDGSKDQTLEVLNRFAGKNVQIVTQANQGAAVARNTAFAHCQGEYIQWLDADDLLEPDKIERQIRALDSGGSKRTLLAGSWGSFVYRKRKAKFKPTGLWASQAPIDWMLLKMGRGLHMQTDNWLVSRELTQAAGPWDLRLWRDNDGEYFARVQWASDGIKFVPEAKSYYREAGFKSISYIGGSNKKLESLFLSMKLHMQYLRAAEDTPRTRACCVDYIHIWAREFYPYRPDLVEALRAITTQLGGQFKEPSFSWKYNWISKIFGAEPARRAQRTLPRLKKTVRIAWDKAMFQAENRARKLGFAIAS